MFTLCQTDAQDELEKAIQALASDRREILDVDVTNQAVLSSFLTQQKNILERLQKRQPLKNGVFQESKEEKLISQLLEAGEAFLRAQQTCSTTAKTS